ncbi:hypothetical protein N7493_009188 [Penicillium malachiteum]|uniref:Uncharacterized protein n=1 Tax=Penicillium malachiteum TaxID=1324776 RepID=A0AAD6HGE2_9EURO|nr:hypothetical protein N7493_009188 [Penicillium malachiteum]
METPSSEASASVKPAQLLWNYELARINDSLTSQLQAAKSEADNARTIPRLLRKAIKEMMLLQISVNTAYGKSVFDGNLQLKHLYPQFRLACKSTQDLFAAVQAAINPSCQLDLIIPYVECLGDLLNALREIEKIITDTKETLNRETQLAKSGETKQAAPVSLDNSKPPDRTSPDIKPEDMDDFRFRHFPNPTIDDLKTQNGRSLEQYLKDARKLHCRLRQKNRFDESLFIGVFIDGLDKTIYRRRIIHTLRKETWDWAWVKHMVTFIILEEQYFEKQAYALAHQQEDGSVILPDGTKQNRFVVIEPITEEDLSASDEE